MNVDLVMKEMGVKLANIGDTPADKLMVKPFNAQDITPPMASISLPREPVSRTDYSFRQAQFDVLVMLSAGDQASSQEKLGKYGSDKDPLSIALALESSGTNTYEHCKEVTVVSYYFDSVNVAGIDYVALLARVEAEGNDEE